MKKDPESILIVGGGIGGVTAALCFARLGYRVEVFEQAEEFGEVGAGIQLSPNCTRVLHDLGLESGLRKVAFLPESVEIREWNSGRMLTSNPLGRAMLDTYGLPYYHVHRGDLIGVLVEAAERESNITLRPGTAVVSAEQGEFSVAVRSTAGEYEGGLLVGADGIHSVVRAGLFGAESPTFTGNVAWRGLVPADRLPHGLIRPVTAAWWGPHRHFVHYFVRGGELVNCVCVVEKEGWEVESWTERGDHAELKADFAGWHETIETLIDHMDREACFKWALFDRPPMDRWAVGRITLLGDACHPTLPFMAQGAAMAIEDGAVLARCVVRGDDVASSLERYESSRRGRTARIQAGSRRNAQVFHMSGIRAWMRNRAVGVARANIMDWLYSYNALNQ